MTAIVGILNKQALAVAADSAVTIGRGRKIYNTANKIFMLSKYHPVGVAIYSNAAFNDCVPWETIIKMYRQERGDASKNTIKEYAEDFFKYLEEFKNEHISEQELNKALCRDVLGFWQSIVVANASGKKNQEELSKEDIPNVIKVLEDVKRRCIGTVKNKFLETVSKEQFLSAIGIALSLIAKQFEKCSANYENYKGIIEDVLYTVFINKTEFVSPIYSGMAFFGFGEMDIYPVLFKTRVYLTKVSTLHWEPEEYNQVKEPPKDAVICPMGQSDEMYSFIAGVNPYMENMFFETTKKTVSLLLNSIADLTQFENPPLSAKIRSVDLRPFINQYIGTIKQIKQNDMISPLVQTVSSMGKEDLAELAENLVYQTSLKRHITPNLESVGGPIDVAVVSKGDGFIWIKRKHYFKPDLNQYFFENYFGHK